jgi:hypothetical protein
MVIHVDLKGRRDTCVVTYLPFLRNGFLSDQNNHLVYEIIF